MTASRKADLVGAGWFGEMADFGYPFRSTGWLRSFRASFSGLRVVRVEARRDTGLSGGPGG